jgi:hypothetical protein
MKNIVSFILAPEGRNELLTGSDITLILCRLFAEDAKELLIFI